MKIYLSEPIHADALSLLQARADIVDTFDEAESLDAIIIRAVTVTEETMARAKNLKVIGKHGIGYDSIDIAAAKRHGIRVVYTPLANVRSVAELVVTLMLAASRKLSNAIDGVRTGAYDRIGDPSLGGVELNGKTLGLVGTGNIARTVAAILQAGFGMRVLGYDPYADREALAELSIELCPDLKAMLTRCDHVSVSVPLNDSTRNLIGEAELQACKKGCVFVNTARGGIVDEDALYRALTQGPLRAGASDVFLNEPPTPANKLVGLPNFIATPHYGASTEEAMYRVGMTVIEEVFAVLDGKTPRYPVA
ncbi:MAG: hydroxyacid dehydrogenase [Planctomycetaceae bacterium]|nr:hydroxyacid dehydrogenase [Planctomycetaceae bacterium]